MDLRFVAVLLASIVLGGATIGGIILSEVCSKVSEMSSPDRPEWVEMWNRLLLLVCGV